MKEAVYIKPNLIKQKCKDYWPFMVWLGVAMAAFLVYHFSGRQHTMQGTVHKVIDSISSLETARILSIKVRAGDHVETGDVLVQLDTTHLNAEMLMLEEQINTAKLLFQMDQLTLKRQFAAAAWAHRRWLTAWRKLLPRLSRCRRMTPCATPDNRPASSRDR